MLILGLRAGFSQPADSLFRMAAMEYKKGDYALAAQLYSDMIRDGVTSAEVYYNLGNCHFKMKDIGHAVLNYERALKLDARNPDVLYNLAIVNSLTKDDLQPAQRLFILQWWLDASSILPAQIWLGLHIFLFTIFLFFAGYFLIIKHDRKKRRGFRLAILSLVLSVLFLALGWQRHYSTQRVQEAVVVSEEVTVMSGPGADNTGLTDFHEGTKLQVLGVADDWYEIKSSDGHRGWVPGSDIEQI